MPEYNLYSEKCLDWLKMECVDHFKKHIWVLETYPENTQVNFKYIGFSGKGQHVLFIQKLCGKAANFKQPLLNRKSIIQKMLNVWTTSFGQNNQLAAKLLVITKMLVI